MTVFPDKASSPRMQAPALYRLGKELDRRGVRGSSRLLNYLRRRGALDRPVSFPLSDIVRIIVPIARNPYDGYDLANYENDFIEAINRAIAKMQGPVTLVDGGADIGLFALKMIATCPSIVNLVAFEPNNEGFRWLQLNCSGLKIHARAIASAVADFEGRGNLVAPQGQYFGPTGEGEGFHTAFFLQSAPDGAIPVTTIDAVLPSCSTNNLVIKLDVEGGELSALRGAKKLITNTPNLIVAFEAHPAVAKRTGVDPIECARFLASLRPFGFSVSETGTVVTTDRPLFEQIPPNQIYNLIARST